MLAYVWKTKKVNIISKLLQSFIYFFVGEPSVLKIVGRETLLKEKEAKRQVELEKAAEKERKKAELAAAQAAKEAQKRIPPNEIFKLEKDKYSKFDETVSLCVLLAMLCLINFCFRVFQRMMLKVKRLVKVS